MTSTEIAIPTVVRGLTALLDVTLVSPSQITRTTRNNRRLLQPNSSSTSSERRTPVRGISECEVVALAVVSQRYGVEGLRQLVGAVEQPGG